MANRDPMSGVATIAINARGTPTKGLRKDTTTKTMNAQKPRAESSAVFVTWSHLAPSARAGSERPAAATIMRTTRPTQKIGEGPEELPMITNQSVVFEKSRTIATRTPEQTTSEARPASAASATRSQTLCTATPQARPDRSHTSGSPSAVKLVTSYKSSANLITRDVCLPHAGHHSSSTVSSKTSS